MAVIPIMQIHRDQEPKARNPKSETMLKAQMTEGSKLSVPGMRFWSLPICSFGFVSDFVFRISCF
jgi:hypothetical protein